MRSLATLPLFVIAVIGAGCSLDSLPLAPADDPSCPEARRGTSGECCPPWTIAAEGGCAPRTWALPDEGSGVGEAGARWINVSVDGNGKPGAAWIEGGVGTSRVAVAEAAEGGFTLHYPAAALPGEGAQSDVALGPDGEAVATWKQQFPGGEARIFVAEREPDGAWRDPVSSDDTVSFLPTAFEPRARISPGGERLVVWNQWMSTGYGVQLATRPAGGDWHLPADADDTLSQHTLFANAPKIVVNARGDALIAWYQSLGASLLAWYSERHGADGTFSRPAPGDHLSLADTPVDSHPFGNPAPALSETGEAAVAWAQENGKGSVLVYLATRTPEGVWTRPVTLDDALSPRLGYARCPQIAFTPAGELFVVWYQDTGGGDRVLAAHRTAAGEWVEPGREPTVLSTPGVEASFPALAVGPGGTVLAVWTERQGDTWVVAARRRVESGTTWGPIEILSVPNGGLAAQPVAAIGGPDDSVVVGWIQGAGKGDRAYFATMSGE